MSSVHLVIAAHDGITTYYTGIGTIVHNTVLILAKHRSLLPRQCKVHLATIAIDSTGPIFDPACFDSSAELTATTGGHLIRLCNGMDRQDTQSMWGCGQPEHWKMGAAALASVLAATIPPDEPSVVMCHDSPFLYFQQTKHQMGFPKLHTFFFTHSTGLNHGRVIAACADQKRIEYERTCLESISADPDATLCATGRWFADHLAMEYGVTPDPRHSLHNGLFLDAYANALRTSPDALFSMYPDLADAHIIFAWGRCSRVKGFLPLIEGWTKISMRYPRHILVIQAPDQSGEPDYRSELLSAMDGRRECVLIDSFAPSIWQAFLRCKATEVVCIPSLADPNPHTPMEAKLFAPGSAFSIVASRVDGIADSLLPGEAILVDDPHNPAEWASRLEEALCLPPTVRVRMAERNRSTIGNFNFEANVLRFLDGSVIRHLNDD